MNIAMMMTFTFLVLLMLSFFTFSLLTAIRKAEFEEAIPSPAKEEQKQEDE